MTTYITSVVPIMKTYCDNCSSAANPCDGNNCSHVCLLTVGPVQQFSCGCPEGYELDTPTLCKSECAYYTYMYIYSSSGTEA